ncbi:glycosyltransferase family 2 protein [Engelhardtia mirabilis]|uniref:Glycosyltransferase EpsH n=1 Tax=Engelhardtia mirabilis TaxID=2528011 RepID=A0A518BEU2_9BACT|nr:Putative glycosyltransferase EpsH [Planctomycetes bacterium Pla133]QDU99831.1 Putative glycosyltransferase EpsH [Planctomycetes bacterium Pla86]
MRSVIVLGCGGSGIAACAAALVGAGRSVGPDPVPPSLRQPLGVHHSSALDALLERLLRPGAAPRPRTAAGRAWLAPRRPERPIVVDEAARDDLARIVAAEPFCLAHPGLAAAWPALHGELPSAALRVVVFRDPATTVAALVDSSAFDPQERMHAEADHLGHWLRTYRGLLAAAEHDGAEWHFVELDELIHGAGAQQLADHAGAVATHVLDPLAPRPAVEDHSSGAAADEARALLAELRARATATPRATPPVAPAPHIAAVALSDGADLAGLAALRARVAAQRGVAAELIVVDTSFEGGLQLEGATVVHEPCPSRGAALARAAAATDAELLALVDPRCTDLPTRLIRAARALGDHPELDLVTTDLYLVDGPRLADRVHPGEMGDVPAAFWWATLTLRRELLLQAPRAAFRRAELALLAQARATSKAGHLELPTTLVELRDFRAAASEAAADGALLALDARALPADTAPALSVLCCSYQRRETLVRGMESFARQELAPGTFELVLVNDGSTDGTAELLDGLELPIPARVVHRENGKLAAARNSGLAVARGELVLLVNDDTIAHPDLVERHLRTHARLGEQRVCVLGTFEQRPAALDNALLRHLEGSWEVFGYSQLEPQSFTDALHFYTCNVSVPLAALRECGGYDRTFQHYGCEDTDVGVRLEQLGYRVFYDDRARAWHDDRFGFDYLKRRQAMVARAFVRLFLRHPAVRARWEGEPESLAMVAHEQWDAARLAAAEAAARTLATTDLGALEAFDEHEFAAQVCSSLGNLTRELHRQWWLQGTAQGLREAGLTGLDQVVDNEGEPVALTTTRPRRILAWPRYDDPESLARLFAITGAALRDPRVALVLRFDPARDGDRAQVDAALERAYHEHFPAGDQVEFDLVCGPLDDRWDWLRLRRSIDVTAIVGGEPEALLRFVDTELLDSAALAQEWLATFGPARESEPVQRAALGSGPELSVVVPTCNRPRELGQLLLALANQSLDADRFEVIVVDDGSTRPARELIEARPWPFELRWLRQENAGPGAARNRGVESARAPVVVFFNDDAIPLEGCLAAHLAAQRGDVVPHAVLGSFPLIGRRRQDPFAELMERSTMLFAQPAMKAGVLYQGLAFCTGNISVRREVLERLGGFDGELPFAGAEDSELGLRMERELNLRVRYLPQARAGHDHQLEVRGFARRQRVLGWSIARMARKHGDASLIEPGLDSADPAFWARLAADMIGSEAELERLVEAVAAASSPIEDEARRGAQAEALRPHVERVREIAFRQGLLLAQAGVSAERLHDTPLEARRPRALAS